jgi:GNAT superfamily N-acetyltransferase
MEFKLLKGQELNALVKDKTLFPDTTFDCGFVEPCDYFCALEGNEVLAVIPIAEKEDNIHVEILEVAENKRHSGVGKAFLKALFEYAVSKNKIITTHNYHEEESSRLIPEVARLLKEYPGRLEFYPAAAKHGKACT